MSNFAGWIFVFVGPMCSGKTTLLKELSKLSELAVSQTIDIGDHLRKCKENDETFRNKVEPIMTSGRNLPDDLINKEFKQFIEKAPKSAPVFCSGYPQSVGQTEYLLSLRRPIALIKVEMSREEANNIMMERRADRAGRSDDNPESFENRWREYEDKHLAGIKLLERELITRYSKKVVIIPSFVRTGGSIQARAKKLRKDLGLPR
ncbi:MAG: nucleoside monophosphate kinase, partial [Patescibacteria group bacterium]